MDVNRAIFNARQALAAKLNASGNMTVYATIKSVDNDKRTCVVTIDDADFTDVLLYAVENTELKGFVAIPKVGSNVLVSGIGGGNELYVAMFSEIDMVLMTINDKVSASIDTNELKYTNDKVSLKITGDKVELGAEQIIFNGGDNKGLVKIMELTDKINALVDSFNGHTHTLMSGAVAVSGSATAQTNPSPIQVPAIVDKALKLNSSEYENDNIQH